MLTGGGLPQVVQIEQGIIQAQISTQKVNSSRPLDKPVAIGFTGTGHVSELGIQEVVILVHRVGIDLHGYYSRLDEIVTLKKANIMPIIKYPQDR